MVHYTVTVTNTGGVDLTGVAVTDKIEAEGTVTLGVPGTPGAGVTIVSSGGGTPGDTTLSVNEVWTYTFDHTVTVAEYNAEQSINGGDLSFNNVASVVSTQTTTPVTANASVVVEAPPVVVDAISVTKDVTDVGGHGAAAHVNVAGEVVTYQIIVNNTGQNDPLTNVVVTDTGEAGVAGSLGVPGALGASVVSFSESGSGTHGNSTLDPGEIWTYTVQYTAKQTDLDTNGVDNDGLIDNLATATATDAVTNANVAGSDTASVPVDQLPSLTIAKDVTESSATAAGETLHYTITVHNTGNIDLSSVAITDALNGAGLSVPATPASGDTTHPGLLDVGETWVYSASHVVTQAEMDGGTALHNIATVTTNHTSAQSDDATTTISQQPSLTIAKDVTESSATAAGETLHYTITVHNTGNIDLSSVAITDALNGVGAVGAGDAGERRRERRGRARCGRDLGVQRQPRGDAGGDGWRHGAAQHRHGDDQPHQRAVRRRDDDDLAAAQPDHRQGRDGELGDGGGRDAALHDHGAQHRQHRPVERGDHRCAERVGAVGAGDAGER